MFNFHTHSKDSNSIINIDSVHDIEVDENCFYSLGNHPWFEMESIDLIRKTIHHHPEIIALGECGLDKIKSFYSLENQTLNLRAQIELSEELKLPLILHIVRSHNEIIQLKKEIQPNQKWIIHGFNTYKQQELLLKSGFYLSYGKALLSNKKLQSAFIKTPQENIFLETDDSELDIEKLYTFASALRKISTEQLITQIRKNLKTITNADWLERHELLLGKEEQKRLKNSHVLICGLGGVGSYAGEFIARSGVGKMTIIDGDAFDPTNKNRQLTALDSTIGRNKAVVLGERIKDINPDIDLTIIQEFVQPDRVWEILKETKPDYVMDCIDSITPKLNWMKACIRFKIKIISSMGAGGKLDPSKILLSNLNKTHNCNFASTIKKMLKRDKVDGKRVKVIFSAEPQIKSSLQLTDGKNFKKSFYGTASYMPALFGLHASAEVIRYLSKK